MSSKAVTSSRLLLCFILVCSFAAAQVTTSLSRAPRVTAPSSQRRAQAPEIKRGPVTPADLALKSIKQSSSQPHPWGAGPSLLSSPIFLTALTFDSAGSSTHSVAAGDLNGDGKIDLVLADQCANNSNCSSGSVSVLVGNGDGTFQTAVSYSTGALNALSVAVGDVNNDGKLDVIVASNCDSNNCSNGVVSVLLGNGDGTLQAPATYNAGGQQSQFATIADVNGDGKLDIVATSQCLNNNNCSTGVLGVLLGNGDGTFQAAVVYNAGGLSTLFAAVQDVNGDGKPDLVAVNNCADNNCISGSASVLLGNGDGTFQPAVTYNSGAAPISVAVADVNGDGKPDVIIANICNSTFDCSHGLVSLLTGNGDGTFQPMVSYASGGQYAYSVAATDINGDGKLDLIVANQTASDGNYLNGSVASVLLGNGDGTFKAPVSYASDDFNGSSIVVADVDGNGKPDVVMASGCIDNYSCSTGGVSVLLGNGDGTLQGGVDYEPGAWSAFSVATADVNGDGKLDLLLANQCSDPNSCGSGAASVLLGNGDGTFQPAVTYNSGGQTASTILSADVNGDGLLDLVVGNVCASSNCPSGSFSVLLGNGDGTFQTAVSYGTSGLYAYYFAIADVNGDGKLDVIAANQCADNNCTHGTLSLLLGNGDGTFQTGVSYDTGGQSSFSVAVADVNGDGKPDLLVSSQCVENNSCANGLIGVLLGNGDGTFQPAVEYNSGGVYAYALAVGDVNGDGKPDVVVANQCSSNSCHDGSIAVLLGNGDGTFQAAAAFVTPMLGNLQTLALADFNGDHKLDVASGAGNVLLLGNGDGTFQSPINLGASGQGMAVGDFNGDGRPDLAVGGVTVLLNISGGFATPTLTTVVSSANPSTPGESVTFTATVTAQSGTPTGTVTFSDGSTTLAQVALTNGTAAYATSALNTATHSITASYSGDSQFAASVSSALSQVVQKADTTTTLNAAPGTANVSQSVTLTATVASGSSGVPTGTVSFLDGANQIGSGNLNGSGVATFSTSSLAAGTHSLTAVYGGSGAFNGSTSTASSVVVTATGFSLSSSAMSPSSIAPGSSAQSTITITPVGGLSASSVSLTCSVAPVVSPAATCSLSAVSVSGGSGSATLTVGTTGPHAALVPQSREGNSGKLLALALLIPGLVLCGTGMAGSNRKKVIAFAIAFLVLTGCMLQTGCSGVSSSSSGTPSAGTPAGTYTVTVTGSASGMQQTTTASVTVQ